MKITSVRTTVKPDHIRDVETAIEAFFAELGQLHPEATRRSITTS